MADTPSSSGNPLGSVPVKNILDIADDTILLDSHNENPISFLKNVVAKAAAPNTFRTRNKFYAKFIAQLGSQDTIISKGDGMFDPIIAAINASGGESIQGAKVFVCVAYIEELQHIPFPAENDYDSILRIASNGGVFKSFVYSGEIPKYGDPVVVSFSDTSNRREGNFEYPLVGGATSTLAGGGIAGGGSAGTAGAAGFNGPSGAGNYVSNCGSVKVPKIKKKKKKKSKKHKCPKYHQYSGLDEHGKPKCRPFTAQEKQWAIEEEQKKKEKELNEKEAKKTIENVKKGADALKTKAAKYGNALKGFFDKAKEAQAKQDAEKAKKAGKTTKPPKKKVKKVVPKVGINTGKSDCAPFLGELKGPLTGKNSLDWVEIKSGRRVFVRNMNKGYGFGPAKFGVAKCAHYINGLNNIPGGENTAAQLANNARKVKANPSKRQKKYMKNPAPVPQTNGWFVGDISMFYPGRTPSHVSHQSGIGLDLSIPLTKGHMTVKYSPKGGFRYGYGKSYQNPQLVDWNAVLKFLIYSVGHVKSIVWFDEHIAVAKTLINEAVRTGAHGYTSEKAKKIKRLIRHAGCGTNRFCHANHFHIRMKTPGKWDHRRRYGRIDEKFWSESVARWAEKTKSGARWQERNLPKKGY